MAEWQPLLQSIFVGLIVSFLIAKLISSVLATKHDIRASPPEPHTTTGAVPGPGLRLGPAFAWSDAGDANETESLSAEQGSPTHSGVGSDSDDDDDWEGVESTELDEAFSAATAFVAAAAADHRSQKVSTDVQLQLYGLYKIATEGPCSVPQPSALKMTARAKWQAWQKLGAMTPEDAMQKYIDIVTELYPSWLDGASLSVI
ncbi:hypothetical protein HN873_020021 [Arachis hypogaea]